MKLWHVLVAVLFVFSASACVKPVIVEPVAAPKRVLDVTGAGQALMRVTHDPVDEFCPAISPDGASLLFHVRVNDAQGYLKELTIVGVDPTTGAKRTLYTSANHQADFPTWMADGSGIVYTSNAMGSWSLVRSLSSQPDSGISIIASSDMAPDVTGASVSPNGDKVAFQTKIRDVWNIATIGIEGGNYTLLTEGTRPAFSPDGSQIVFNRVVNGVTQLYLVNAETGTGLVQLTSGDTESINPDWSPDGRYVVFASNRGWDTIEGGSFNGTWNIYAIKADGTSLTQITSGNVICDAPTWAKDNYIYFHSDHAENFDIWRLKAAGALASTL